MYLADLHIHSRFSRATSRDLDAPHLDWWARNKGLGLIGTGDFTHPAWRDELAEALEPTGDGLYRLRDGLALPGAAVGAREPRFVLSAEISTIYKKDGATRKVHHVALVPDFEQAQALSHRLEAIGNLHSDGRPILGLDSHDLLEILLETCPDALYIPAHIWTPHFSLLGAFSGFERVEDCYGDLTPYVHALETGLSSDPPMCRRLSALDRYTLVSNSDAHSPAKLGREANVLHGEPDYAALKRAIETGEGFWGTLEFFPEEGKYHLDGHRACRLCLEPAQTQRLDGRCPVCGRKLTVGVLNRVEQLADRSAAPEGLGKPFQSLMPLTEVLACCLDVSASSKRVNAAYESLLAALGPELTILRDVDPAQAEKYGGPALAEALRRLRAGRVMRKPGYDGEYGVISLFESRELEMLLGQTSLLGLAGVVQRQADTRGVAKRRAQTPPAPAQAADNPEQQQAVRSQAACTAVIAGPGTGKTRTLIGRIVHLICDCGVAPGEITAVTFTRQAAGEMRQRLETALGKAAARGVTVGTFHAVCLGLVDAKPLVSRQQAARLAETVLQELGSSVKPAQALKLLSLYKNTGERPAGLPDGFARAYGERLDALGARDMDDLLLEALAQDVRGKRMFRHLLVDEFQDINAAQLNLALHWFQGGQSLFVIGDPDQAIYGFRGAASDCFERLAQARPDLSVIRLVQNYRSTPQILACAQGVIRRNPGAERRLVAAAGAGRDVRVIQAPDPDSEAAWVAREIERMVGGGDMISAQALGMDAPARAFSDMAVLCRTHRQLERMEEALRHADLPCMIYGRDDSLAAPVVRGLTGFFASLWEPNAAALWDALGLWGVPDALRQRACEKLVRVGPDAQSLRRALEAFSPLRPWLAAVEEFAPLRKAEKPRRLLERLAQRCAAQGREVERLLNVAALSPSMAELLALINQGEEADIRRLNGGKASGSVRLMTLHGAKGLEFPVVFLCGLTRGVLPPPNADVQEERRLLYVGLTRAREELIVTFGGEASCFVPELPGKPVPVARRARAPKTEQLRLF